MANRTLRPSCKLLTRSATPDEADESLISIPEICGRPASLRSVYHLWFARRCLARYPNFSNGRRGRRGLQLVSVCQDLREYLESLQGLIGLSPRGETAAPEERSGPILPPPLRPDCALIGTTQSRLTAELRSSSNTVNSASGSIVSYRRADRGVDQVLLVGRTLDDVSRRRSQRRMETSMAVLLGVSSLVRSRKTVMYDA